MSFKIPFGIIAIFIKLGKSRRTVTNRYQCQLLRRTGNLLRHNPVRTIRQLINPPQLLGYTGKCRNRYNFASAVAANARSVPSITIL